MSLVAQYTLSRTVSCMCISSVYTAPISAVTFNSQQMWIALLILCWLYSVHLCIQTSNNNIYIGPLKKTVVDFWRMIWQENVHTVAMVTNLKENNKIKCQQYWPDDGSKKFGPFIVTITDQQVFADYIIRLLQLQVSYCSTT